MKQDLNSEQLNLIKTTAIAVLRNGQSFVEWIESTRKGNQSYDFLFGGLGSDYFRFLIEHKGKDPEVMTVQQPTGQNGTRGVRCVERAVGPLSQPLVPGGPVIPVEFTRSTEEKKKERSLYDDEPKRSNRPDDRNRAPSRETRARRADRSRSRDRYGRSSRDYDRRDERRRDDRYDKDRRKDDRGRDTRVIERRGDDKGKGNWWEKKKEGPASVPSSPTSVRTPPVDPPPRVSDIDQIRAVKDRISTKPSVEENLKQLKDRIKNRQNSD
jgi:hypothetical protein